MFMKKLLVILVLSFVCCALFGENKDFEIKNGVLIKYTGKSCYVTLPNNVRVIGKEAFYKTNIQTINCDTGSLSSIEDYAFAYCSSLREIKFPYSLRDIGSNVFYNCSQLTSISIPQNIYRIKPYAFSYSGIREMTFKMNKYDNISKCSEKMKYGFENTTNLNYVYFEFAYNKILVYDVRHNRSYWKQ